MGRTFQIKKSKESGQSLVELAVSLIILLILLAGIVDLGRIAFYYIAMRDAAQEGASYGSIFPHDCTEIVNRVKAGAVDSSRIEVTVNVNGSPCQVCQNDSNVNCSVYVGNKIEVIVADENFPITMPLIGAFIGQQISLETSIEDNVIRIPECKCNIP